MKRRNLSVLATVLLAFVVQAAYVGPSLAYTPQEPKSCCGGKCPRGEMPQAPMSCCFVAPQATEPASLSVPQQSKAPAVYVLLPQSGLAPLDGVQRLLPPTLVGRSRGTPLFLLDRSLLL
jgi:hypothetical protein